MKPIKIAFCDWYRFDTDNNRFRFIKLLRKHYEVDITEGNPDFLFYSGWGNKHLTYKNCVKIFWTDEAATPNFNECDFAITCNFIEFENRHLRLKSDVTKVDFSVQDITPELADRKFCNFIYSQDYSGEGALLRKKFCRLLSTYKRVDCPGYVLNNMQNAIPPRDGNWRQGKMDFIKNYKFTIGFENCAQIGYFSDKILQPLAAHSLPIYWGDPEVGRVFNTKAFVNVRDFDSMDAVVDYVKYLDTHDEAYLAMLKEKPLRESEDIEEERLERFLCSIIERGNHPFNKNPRMMWDTSLNLLCTNTMELAERCIDAGQKSKAKEHANTCLALDSVHRSRIYPVLEDIYREDREEFLHLLHQRKNSFQTMQIIRPENLHELCEIAKCFVHLNEIAPAQEIVDYVLQEDPDNSHVRGIPLEQGKRGGRIYRFSSAQEQYSQIFWAQKYHDSLADTKWFHNRKISPAGGQTDTEVGYNYLYPLYRILDEYRPQSILEFHLGQATKMVAQYAEQHRASHMVLENDRERVAHLTRLWKVPWDCTTFYFSALREAQVNGKRGIIYQDYTKAVENRRYDLLLLKSPLHGNQQVHMDLLLRFEEILAEEFAVLIDHTEAECGDMVFRSMTGILEKHGIPCIGKRFSAPEREAGLLFSARWKYMEEF